MRTTYQWLARLIALGVVFQAAFVAFGTFDVFNAADDGRAFTADTAYNAGQTLHSVVGMMIIPALALVLLIVSFFAGIPGGIQIAVLVLGLVVAQVVLGLVSFPVPWLGLLHGINAFVLAGVAGGLAGQRAARALAAERLVEAPSAP
jgi:hypothetical protein